MFDQNNYKLSKLERNKRNMSMFWIWTLWQRIFDNTENVDVSQPSPQKTPSTNTLNHTDLDRFFALIFAISSICIILGTEVVFELFSLERGCLLEFCLNFDFYRVFCFRLYPYCIPWFCTQIASPPFSPAFCQGLLWWNFLSPQTYCPQPASLLDLTKHTRGKNKWCLIC